MVQSWRQLLPVRLRIPAPEELVVALAGYTFLQGFQPGPVEREALLCFVEG